MFRFTASKCMTASVVAGAAALITGDLQADSILFRDRFDGPSGVTRTNLNTNQNGQSGLFARQDWLENNIGGADAVISNGNLELRGNGSSGLNGSIVYLDYNFTQLGSFEVEVRYLNGQSGGNARRSGFSVGQSKQELANATGASSGRIPGDVFIAYDTIGPNPSDRGLFIGHNGVAQQFINQTQIDAIDGPGFGYPALIKAVFTYDDMNAGTALNYEVFLGSTSGNVLKITDGTTAWSGTNENYIAMASNYNNFSRVQTFQVNGVVIPEPGSITAGMALGGLMLLRRRRGK